MRAEDQGKQNVAFVCRFLLGQLDACADLLVSCGRLPEAAFFARTYLPSKTSEASAGACCCMRVRLCAHACACAALRCLPGQQRREDTPPPAASSQPASPRARASSQVVRLWREDLARINPKAAESLADPEQYPNLFPGLDEALEREAALRAGRATRIPAAR